jgi:hypothetical protein
MCCDKGAGFFMDAVLPNANVTSEKAKCYELMLRDRRHRWGMGRLSYPLSDRLGAAQGKTGKETDVQADKIEAG